MGHPMVEMETAIGRHTGKDALSPPSQRISTKSGDAAGWIANVCTLMINMYYVVVGGWVAKYAFQYVVSGDFGSDKQAYYDSLSLPLPYRTHHLGNALILAFVSIMLYFGITNTVEKIAKVMMPVLFRPADHLRHMGTGRK